MVPSPEVPEWSWRVDGSGEGSGVLASHCTIWVNLPRLEPFSTCERWAEWYFLHRVDVRAQKDKAHRALAFLFVKSVTLLFPLAVTTREDTRRVHCLRLPPFQLISPSITVWPQSRNNVGHCSKGLGSTWPRSPRLLENSGIKTSRNTISFPSFREPVSQWAGAGSSLRTQGPSLLSLPAA